DTELFASAMVDVVPLPRSGDRVGGGPPAAHRRPVSEEAEALAELSDLVAGVARFDITDTREYVEGLVVGLDPRLIRRLRRGDFSWQGPLHPHWFSPPPARGVVHPLIPGRLSAPPRCGPLVHRPRLDPHDPTPPP